MAAGFVKSCSFVRVKEIDWNTLRGCAVNLHDQQSLRPRERESAQVNSASCFMLCRATASSLQTSVAHSQTFLFPAMSLLAQEVYSKFLFDF